MGPTPTTTTVEGGSIISNAPKKSINVGKVDAKSYERLKKSKKPKGEKKSQIQMHGLNYEMTGRGNKLLVFNGHRFIKNNEHGQNIYWKCTKWHSGCMARAISKSSDTTTCVLKNTHNHVESFFE